MVHLPCGWVLHGQVSNGYDGAEVEMESQRESLKLSVASCLTRVLGSDQHARKQAEEELKALEVTEGTCYAIPMSLCYAMCYAVTEFGVVLADMTASADSPVQYRQVPSCMVWSTS